MNNWRKILYVLLAMGAIFASILSASEQKLINKFENPAFSLRKRLFIILKQILDSNSPKRVWVGYSIKQNTPHQGSSFKMVNSPSLKQLLVSNNDGSIITNNTAERAILIDYGLESGRPLVFQVYNTSLERPFDLQGRELYWLGNIPQNESIDWLFYLFKHNNYHKVQRQILSAIDKHAFSLKIYQFFYNILFGKFDNKIKEDSIFLLGRHPSRWSDFIFTKLIAYHNDVNLIRKAILAFGHSKSKRAFDIISLIAIKSKNRSLKKDAIFSLGIMEHSKALKILKYIAVNDNDPEIQQFAVFVISRIPNKKALSLLNWLAARHPNPRVKKKALYWLDKSYNQKALDNLMEISISPGMPSPLIQR